MATKAKSATAKSTSRAASRSLASPEMPPIDSMPWADPTPWTGGMGWTPAVPWKGGTAASVASSIVRRDGQEVSGEAILAIARQHIGERYVLGARAPMANAGWKGPWDCAEFVSWCLYQASGILFRTEPRSDPVRADAYTGYWAQQPRAAGCAIPVAAAAATIGAVLLRYPQHGTADRARGNRLPGRSPACRRR